MSFAAQNMITVQTMERMIGGGLAPMARRAEEAKPSSVSAPWNVGDGSVAGANLTVVAERLAATLGLRAGRQVLDVGAGNGSIALTAGRRGCEVESVHPLISSSHLDASIERNREVVVSEKLAVDFQPGDPDALPCEDESFDVVASIFGAMFASDPDAAIDELWRVCRPGGAVGLTVWTENSFIGRLFENIRRHAPVSPVAGWPSVPAGAERFVEEFEARLDDVETTSRSVVLRFDSPRHWLQTFKAAFAPLRRAMERMNSRKRDELVADLLALVDGANLAEDGTVALRADYLEIVARKPE